MVYEDRVHNMNMHENSIHAVLQMAIEIWTHIQCLLTKKVLC